MPAFLKFLTALIAVKPVSENDRKTPSPLDLSSWAVSALIEEAELTPKPALVDRGRNGAHRDLDLAKLRRSARALEDGFTAIAETAWERATSIPLRERLGWIGRTMERQMMDATDGSNAHRGAIWSVGLVVAAAAQRHPDGSAAGIAAAARALARLFEVNTADFWLTDSATEAPDRHTSQRLASASDLELADLRRRQLTRTSCIRGSIMSTQANQADQSHRKKYAVRNRPPFECIALVLQGGGALGAYQAGVYQGLSEARLDPDWVAGISIGAINSALIAGNPPEVRVEKLRAFWELVTTPPPWSSARFFTPLGDIGRRLTNQASAALSLARGAPGFFAARIVVPWLQPTGSVEATSYYDLAELKATLERLVDFDRINAGETRFSAGAVNVTTGNFIYFDNTTHTIGPEHVMASGAMPPGFPAVEIAGEHYWDGGLVSNTPLEWVLESEPRRDTLAFQVDLWSARGAFPRNMAEVTTRQKEIQYSSRTRAGSNRFKRTQRQRNVLSRLLQKLPDDLKDSPEFTVLSSIADRKVYNLVQLIYSSQRYEGDSKDYEFSRQSMEDHWRVGYRDTVRTLRHPEVLERPKSLEGVLTFDLANDGRE